MAALVVLVIFECRCPCGARCTGHLRASRLTVPPSPGEGEFVRSGRAIFGAVDQMQVVRMLTVLAAIQLVSLTRNGLLISFPMHRGCERGCGNEISLVIPCLALTA